jgi:hypothetical protein
MSQHLTTAHGLDAAKASSRLDAYHVGPNHQYGFWCGFCRRVIQLRAPFGVEALDERFTHIDGHLVREKRPIEGWVDVRACVTKLEMRLVREGEERTADDEARREAAEVLVEAAGRARVQKRRADGAARAAKRRRDGDPPSAMALAACQEAEERSERNKEAFGHTIWICVSSLGRYGFLAGETC